MGKRYRSAVSGEYITKEEALENPDTSVSETIGRVVYGIRNRDSEKVLLWRVGSEDDARKIVAAQNNFTDYGSFEVDYDPEEEEEEDIPVNLSVEISVSPTVTGSSKLKDNKEPVNDGKSLRDPN